MSRIITEYIPHLHEDKYSIHHRQDCTQILKHNQQLRDELQQTGGSDSYKVAAAIPMVTLWSWGHEDGINYFGHLDRDQSMKLMRRLNDPEFRKLRIWEGKLGIEDTR